MGYGIMGQRSTKGPILPHWGIPWGGQKIWPPLPPGSYLETEGDTCEGPVTPSSPPTPGCRHTHWELDETGSPVVEPLGISRPWALLGKKGDLEVTSCPTGLAPSTNTDQRG